MPALFASKMPTCTELSFAFKENFGHSDQFGFWRHGEGGVRSLWCVAWDLGVSEWGITVVTVGVTATSRALGLNVKEKILIVVCC